MFIYPSSITLHHILEDRRFFGGRETSELTLSNWRNTVLYLCITAVATKQKTLVTNCVPHPVPVGVGCQLIIVLLKAADMFLFVCFLKLLRFN